jgi:hypothetical protein
MGGGGRQATGTFCCWALGRRRRKRRPSSPSPGEDEKLVQIITSDADEPSRKKKSASPTSKHPLLPPNDTFHYFGIPLRTPADYYRFLALPINLRAQQHRRLHGDENGEDDEADGRVSIGRRGEVRANRDAGAADAAAVNVLGVGRHRGRWKKRRQQQRLGRDGEECRNWGWLGWQYCAQWDFGY